MTIGTVLSYIWLTILLIFNLLIILTTFLSVSIPWISYLFKIPTLSLDLIGIIVLSLAIFKILSIIAVMRWKIWGLYGLIISSLVYVFFFGLLGVKGAHLIGFIIFCIEMGFLLLFLHIGGLKKAWYRLN